MIDKEIVYLIGGRRIELINNDVELLLNCLLTLLLLEKVVLFVDDRTGTRKVL